MSCRPIDLTIFCKDLIYYPRRGDYSIGALHWTTKRPFCGVFTPAVPEQLRGRVQVLKMFFYIRYGNPFYFAIAVHSHLPICYWLHDRRREQTISHFRVIILLQLLFITACVCVCLFISSYVCLSYLECAYKCSMLQIFFVTSCGSEYPNTRLFVCDE